MTFWLYVSPRRLWLWSPRSSARSNWYGRSSVRFATDEQAAVARQRKTSRAAASARAMADTPVTFRLSAIAFRDHQLEKRCRRETTRLSRWALGAAGDGSPYLRGCG